jgi:hypothetical protein
MSALIVGSFLGIWNSWNVNECQNTSNGGFRFIEREETAQQYVAGVLPSEELLAYLKTPWGGDTLNITGTFIKKNQHLWHIFLMARENLYQR